VELITLVVAVQVGILEDLFLLVVKVAVVRVVLVAQVALVQLAP
jgi:hypothetical protein